MEKNNCLRCNFRHTDNGNCTAVGGFCTAVPAAHCPLLRQYLDTGLTPEEVLPKDKADEIALKLMRRVKNDINDNDYELCVSCAHELRKWFNMENAPVTVVSPAVHGVHGRWAHIGGDEWCCSACGFVITTEGSWDKPTKKYCEDCGAKMDGGDNDAAD